MGHVIPNLAVIEECNKNSRKHQILYIGSKNGPEKEAIVKYIAKNDLKNIEYEGIVCGKLRRYFSLENFLDFFKVPVGVIQSFVMVLKFKPEIVFGKGGFVSVHVFLGAFLVKLLLRRKIFIIAHESDVTPGLGTKICAKFSDKVLLSFEESKKFLEKGEVIGNPVRGEVLRGNTENGLRLCGFNKFKPVILVMGGSLGAMQINSLVWDGLDALLKKYQVVHIVGKGNLKFGLHKVGYKQFELLFDELRDIYSACDVVVSRGGANSLTEIAALQKKAVIIPLGTLSSRGDQLVNAKVCAGLYGWQVLSGDITSTQFLMAIEMAEKSSFPKDLEVPHKKASKAIFDILFNLTSG